MYFHYWLINLLLNFIVHTSANSGLFQVNENSVKLDNWFDYEFLSLDAKRLYDDLMSGYNRVVRPVSNIS